MYVAYIRIKGFYRPVIAFTIRNKVPSIATGKTATPNTTINE
jgi:hypothetical protein